MKKMMIMGGMTGFVIGVALGLVKGVTWPTLLLRASIATLVSGLLLRWWARHWVQSLRDSLAQQALQTTSDKPAAAASAK